MHYLFYRGSPACAGIDLLAFPCTFHNNRLPRVRGDRPIGDRAMDRVLEAPPRARGSTLYVCYIIYRKGGSPACAGIDLPV